MKTVITVYTVIDAMYKDDFALRAFMVIKPNESTRYFIEETCFDNATEVNAESFASFIRANKLASSHNSIILPL